MTQISNDSNAKKQCVYINIYMYIYQERQRDRDNYDVYVSIHMNTRICRLFFSYFDPENRHL